jgi:hypothetical protein
MYLNLRVLKSKFGVTVSVAPLVVTAEKAVVQPKITDPRPLGISACCMPVQARPIFGTSRKGDYVKVIVWVAA